MAHCTPLSVKARVTVITAIFCAFTCGKPNGSSCSGGPGGRVSSALVPGGSALKIVRSCPAALRGANKACNAKAMDMGTAIAPGGPSSSKTHVVSGWVALDAGARCSNGGLVGGVRQMVPGAIPSAQASTVSSFEARKPHGASHAKLRIDAFSSPVLAWARAPRGHQLALCGTNMALRRLPAPTVEPRPALSTVLTNLLPNRLLAEPRRWTSLLSRV